MNWDICNQGEIEHIFKHRKSLVSDNVIVTDPKPITRDFAVLINRQQGLEVVVEINAVNETSYEGTVINVRVGDQGLTRQQAKFSLEHIDTLIKV